jgi:hypothetical protein
MLLNLIIAQSLKVSWQSTVPDKLKYLEFWMCKLITEIVFVLQTPKQSHIYVKNVIKAECWQWKHTPVPSLVE